MVNSVYTCTYLLCTAIMYILLHSMPLLWILGVSIVRILVIVNTAIGNEICKENKCEELDLQTCKVTSSLITFQPKLVHCN